MRGILIITIFAIIPYIVKAKDFPKMEDVPVKFSKIDQKKLERANELFKEALDQWKDLTSRYNPQNATTYKIDSTYNRDAYPILVRISEKFSEANKMKLQLYIDNCKDFWIKNRYSSPSGLENAKKLEKESSNYYEKAGVNRRVASDLINKYVDSHNRLFEAISLEIIAVKKQGRALQIYRDWPVHYAYEWDEDIETDLFAEKPKVEVVAKVEEKPVEIAKPKEPEVLAPHDSTIIYYSVQIAAHTTPLTMNYIRNEIYHGPMMVRQIKEDNWYKYLIGKYKEVDQAFQLLREVKVEKAFVVGYRNGRRVPLKELDEKNTNVDPTIKK